jgi:hypothetical protein
MLALDGIAHPTDSQFADFEVIKAQFGIKILKSP